MKKCDLFLELDDESMTYRPGDEVTGVVHVHVGKACPCKALEVSCRWRTVVHYGGQGRGTAGDSGDTVTVFEGAWDEERSYEYQFELQLPSGPCSYDGQNLELRWEIEASADIPWSLDPTVKTKIVVDHQGDPVDGEYAFGLRRYIPKRPGEEPDTTNGSLIGMAGTVAFAVVFFVFMNSQAAELLSVHEPLEQFKQLGRDLLSDPLGIVVVAVMVVVVAGAFMRSLYRRFLKRFIAGFKVGDVKLKVGSREVAAGDTVDATVVIPRESKPRINEVSASLRATEEYRYYSRDSSGSDRRRIGKSEVYREVHTADENQDHQLTHGTSVGYEIKLSVPPMASPSLYAGANNLLWCIEFHVDIEGWPDWEKSVPLRVHPPAG